MKHFSSIRIARSSALGDGVHVNALGDGLLVSDRLELVKMTIYPMDWLGSRPS